MWGWHVLRKGRKYQTFVIKNVQEWLREERERILMTKKQKEKVSICNVRNNYCVYAHMYLLKQTYVCVRIYEGMKRQRAWIVLCTVIPLKCIHPSFPINFELAFKELCVDIGKSLELSMYAWMTMLKIETSLYNWIRTFWFCSIFEC